jgi:hypothetical protein
MRSSYRFRYRRGEARKSAVRRSLTYSQLHGPVARVSPLEKWAPQKKIASQYYFWYSCLTNVR